MSKNILVLMTSPRKSGNTNALCDAFIEGAAGEGHHITKIRWSDAPVSPCTGCNYCASHGGECVQKDGMTKICAAFQEADVIVLASPLYYYSVSAQLKTIIDRLYAIGVINSFTYEPKESVFLMTCMESSEGIFDQALAYYNTLLKRAFPWKSRGTVMVKGLSGRIDSIHGHPALAEAKELGMRL